MKGLFQFEKTDTEILQYLRSGHFERMRGEDYLFKKYQFVIKCSLRKYGLCEEELFDAYSDSVLAVIQAVRNGEFENRSSLKTYLYEIFHHKCIDQVRRVNARKNQVHQTQQIDKLQTLSDKSLSVIDKLAKDSDVRELRRSINHLSPSLRELMLLSADGYSDREIAAMTKFKNADVVKTCRLRSLVKLRQLTFGRCDSTKILSPAVSM